MKTVRSGSTVKEDGGMEHCESCNALVRTRRHTCWDAEIEHTEVYCSKCGGFIMAERRTIRS